MISRRFFVKGLASAGVAAGMPKVGDPHPAVHLSCSALDPLAAKMRKEQRPIRVFVNGREIVDCTAFDSREGWAEFFKFERNGRQTLYSRVYGTVTTEPPIAELAARMVGPQREFATC